MKKFTNSLALASDAPLVSKCGRFRGFMQSKTELGYNSKIEGDVIHTRLDAALNWFRKNSLWPMPMGLACCAIELMAAGASLPQNAAIGRP